MSALTRRLLQLMPRPYLLIVGAISLLVALCGPAGCTNHPPSEVEPFKTYHLRGFGPGESLAIDIESEAPVVLVEILGKDANFRSEIRGTQHQVPSIVALAYLRSAPVYHLIEGASNQKLELEIQPIQTTSHAELTINWYALPTDSAVDRETLDAWRNLTNGIQFVAGEVPAQWEDNLKSLNRAEQRFNQLNRPEQALWAKYFKAYFEYYPLYRYSESLSDAEQIIQKAKALELPLLQLLGHQLAGQILLEREAGGDEAQARRDYNNAHAHFRSVLPIARSMDNTFELIWTFNNMGITSKYQDDPEKALSEYKQALDLAIDLHDRYLVNLIGLNMAVAQESLGNTRSAIETFHRVEAELLYVKDYRELQQVWSQLGSYYLKLYDFPKALKYLNQALETSKERGNAEGRARIHELLARTYREIGQADKSLEYVNLAIPDLEVSRNGRGLRRAYSLAADLNRANGNYVLMRDYRAQQEAYLSTDADLADWYSSQAMDAVAEGSVDHALTMFKESARIYADTPFEHREELALLYACVLDAEPQLSADCNSELLDTRTRVIRSYQASRYMLEGRFLWARLLAKEGRIGLARSEMDNLIYEITYFRKQLPGVLGAWYWDERGDVFRFYMELALQSDSVRDHIAYDLLAVINRLRNTSLQRAPDSGFQGPAVSALDESAQQLRHLVALRERAEIPAEIEKAQRGIDLYLLEHRPTNPQYDLTTDASELRRQLANLPDDWCLLTYHVSEHFVLLWIGTNQGLELHQIPDGAELSRAIASVRLSIRAADNVRAKEELALLGEKLIGPVAKDLRYNILFAPSGALNNFPLEALILDKRFLIEAHSVHTLMAMNRLSAAVDTITKSVQPQRLFLAGNPNMDTGERPAVPASAAELRVVEESFPGASLLSFQSSQLTRQAFQDRGFATAELIHIASHATIDVAYPEFSRIELSSDFLTPADLEGQRLSAQLVVLSACSTSGLSQFEFDSNLGFVSNLLNAGADNVIASLWPIRDNMAREFFRAFYAAVASGDNVSVALRKAKLWIIDTSGADVDDWGAFQLYVK